MNFEEGSTSLNTWFENDITDFRKVSSVIYAYQAEPSEAFRLLEEYGGGGLEYI